MVRPKRRRLETVGVGAGAGATLLLPLFAALPRGVERGVQRHRPLRRLFLPRKRLGAGHGAGPAVPEGPVVSLAGFTSPPASPPLAAPPAAPL